jgi:hypothetical protein
LKPEFNQALAIFRRLPVADRKPVIEDRGPFDPTKARLTPPEGALVLRVFMRALARDRNHQLYAPKMMALNSDKKVPAEAQRDFFWVTEPEWKALVPAEPSVGATFEMPVAIQNRIFRYHLIDACTCVSSHWNPDQVFGGKLTLTVVEASPNVIRLRLRGATAMGVGPKYPVDYQLCGHLTYDVMKKSFTRFDMVAFSEIGHVEGAHYVPRNALTKPPEPLGMVFELGGDKPTDRLPPRGSFTLRQRYLQTEW